MGFKEEIGEDLAKAGRIVRSGWGEKISIGILIGHLESVTPQQVHEYISSQKDLFDNISEEEWEHYRKMVEGISISNIDTTRVMAELKKRRLDILQIMTNTTGGFDWLDSQVKRLRKNLGLTNVL